MTARNKRYRGGFVASFCFVVVMLWGVAEVQAWRLKTIQTAQGDVRCMLDWRGFLWLGSEGGLLQARLRGGRLRRQRTWGTQDGLPSLHIRALLGEKSGLWVGTEKGLAWVQLRGRRLVVRKVFALKRIRALVRWRGRLWVGTFGHGLYVGDATRGFRGTSLAAGRVRPLSMANRIQALAVFADRLWIATAGAGLAALSSPSRFHKRRAYRWFRAGRGLPDGFVFALRVDKKALWIGSATGLTTLQPRTPKRRSTPRRKRRSKLSFRVVRRWRASALVRKGFLPSVLQILFAPKANARRSKGTSAWVCTVGGRVGPLHNGPIAGFRGQSTVHFCKIVRGILWVGSAKGIIQVSPQLRRIVRKYTNHILASSNIATMAWAKERLWIGMFDQGVVSHKAGRWRRHPEIFRQVNHIVTSPRGHVWVATNRGLYAKSAQKRRFRRVSRGPCDVHVNGLHFARGVLSVASVSGVATYELHKRRWRCYNKRRGLKIQHFFAVLRDPKGTLWAGGSHGLVSFDGRKWKHYNTLQGHLPDDWVTSLSWHHGALWVGTYAKGLSRYNPKTKRWTILPNTRRFYVNPNAISGTKHGVLFGSMQGLVLQQHKHQRTWSTRHGLCGNDITAITPSQYGWWIASRSGLNLLTP